jgi:hypothetical protein
MGLIHTLPRYTNDKFSRQLYCWGALQLQKWVRISEGINLCFIYPPQKETRYLVYATNVGVLIVHKEPNMTRKKRIIVCHLVL